MNLTQRIAVICVILAPGPICLAQTAQPAQPAASAAPVSYSSISELNQIIGALNQASQNAQNDLSRLRIEHWKTDSNTKKQTESDTESVLRNLKDALPTIVTQLQNSPENLAATFKLYRNLDALYDVMGSVVESAGAFGSKDEFQSLGNDLNGIDNARHSLADRLDRIAVTKDNEIGQLRVALQNARAEIPPKKTIVDDSEPAKKPTPRKRTPAKPKTTSKPVTGTPSSSQPAQQPTSK